MKSIIILNENLRLIFQRLILNTKVSNLHYFRILIGIYFFISIRNYDFLGEMPNSLFKPDVLNFTNLFDSWPPPFFFSILFYFGITLSIFIILGIKTRISLILLGLILIVQNGFLYSFGKIDHGIMMNILPFVLAFTNCGSIKALIPDKETKFQNLAISILALFIVFGFFTAGLEKAFVWVDFDLNSSGFLSWFYTSFYSVERDQLLAPLVLNFPWWLTEVMDYTAVIFELTGIIFLFINRKTWYSYLLIACLFHLFNTLFLNIGFNIHIIIFGIWLLSPYLKKFKLLILALPLIFIFWNNLILALIGWLLIISFSIYGFVNRKY